MEAPGILKQNGDKGGECLPKRSKKGSKGSNQGKVHYSVTSSRYQSHPQKQGR